MNSNNKRKQEEILQTFNEMKINSETQDRNDQLFKLVFCNVVILRKIYYFIKLERNQRVIFSNRERLSNYKSKQFITKIVYRGKEDLQIGDLPSDGVLKHVVFEYYGGFPFSYGIVIPKGVEVVEFVFYSGIVYGRRTLDLSKFPSTVHTVKGLCESDDKPIPPTITSISYLSNPFIVDSFSIPHTIKEISFSNGKPEIKIGDIPEGVEKLTLLNKVGGITKSVLPASIKHLDLNCDTSREPANYKSSRSGGPDLELNILDILPPNVETLSIICPSLSKLNRDLFICTLITNLSISTCGLGNKLEINSLPPNLTKLKFSNFNFTIEVGCIPKTVIDLTLSYAPQFGQGVLKPIFPKSLPHGLKSLDINRVIAEPNILPESLTHLKMVASFSNVNIREFISILPGSLTSIIVPKMVLNSHFKFPDTIKFDYSTNDYGLLKSIKDSTIDLSEEFSFKQISKSNGIQNSFSFSTTTTQQQSPFVGFQQNYNNNNNNNDNNNNGSNSIFSFSASTTQSFGSNHQQSFFGGAQQNTNSDSSNSIFSFSATPNLDGIYQLPSIDDHVYSKKKKYKRR